MGCRGNAPLRPERIKLTYAKAITWRCRDDPSHSPYRMSPFTRAKLITGCPLCRKVPSVRTGDAARPSDQQAA